MSVRHSARHICYPHMAQLLDTGDEHSYCPQHECNNTNAQTQQRPETESRLKQSMTMLHQSSHSHSYMMGAANNCLLLHLLTVHFRHGFAVVLLFLTNYDYMNETSFISEQTMKGRGYSTKSLGNVVKTRNPF